MGDFSLQTQNRQQILHLTLIDHPSYLMKKKLLIALCFLLVTFAGAQTKPIPIYYKAVVMPSFLKTSYYGLFDTKLLAEDLATLLSRATGKNYLPMEETGISTNGIFLQLVNKTTMPGNETGTVETDGKNYIKITSAYTTGLSYAMYSWLEQLGFHFYLPGDTWTVIPKLNSVFINKRSKKIFKPAFRLRMFTASGGMLPVNGLDDEGNNGKVWMQWYQRNRMGCDYIRIDGHIGEAFNIAHRKEIENDSLIVSPRNGKRSYNVSSKLDPTYAKGVAMFSDWIVASFKKEKASYPSFLPFKKYYTVDAGDGYDYCHTAACESRFPTVSDQVFSIANETSRKIKLADLNAGVSTMAYAERADTPTIRINDNVHIMVVPTAFQSVGTSAELMKRWAKKAKNISVYDYLNIGVWSFDKPFFNLNEYFNNLKFLQSLHIEGLSFEVSLSKFSSGIQQYFILKFLCSPYTSIIGELDEFCKISFGPAAIPIKKLLSEWYFSSVHLKTNYDNTSFYEDELGRFVAYLLEAENSKGITPAIQKRIDELKAYTVYLCKYYEWACELKSLQEYNADPSLRNKKTASILQYTWQLYDTKIFHNTTINDLYNAKLPENERQSWNFKQSNRFKNITANSEQLVIDEFEKIKNKYLPVAGKAYELNDALLASNMKNSADSICIITTDEASFNNFSYPINFYCGTPGILRVKYEASESKGKETATKVAMISVESDHYKYLQTSIVKQENSQGIITFKIPATGHYKLYLSQYNSTHIKYVIYPGSNLFFHNKKSILMNGLIMQDNSDINYPNKYLAINTNDLELTWSNLYPAIDNTSSLFTSSGKPISIQSDKQKLYNKAQLPLTQSTQFVFYRNKVYRWPPVLKNNLPCYFFLKFPLN